MRLYTVNPYTNMAPDFWCKIQVDYLPNTQYTWFEHSLEHTMDKANSLLCMNLYLDKVKYLNGLNVKTVYETSNLLKYEMRRKESIRIF